MARTGKSASGLVGALLVWGISMLAASASAGSNPPPVTWRSPGAANPWGTGSVLSKNKRPAPDPSLSARHLPASLEIKSEAQLRLFRALVAHLRTDSTRHWEISGNRLRISHDMLQDLTGDNLSNGGDTWGQRLAIFLSQAGGVDFQATGTAYATYLPNDKWLLGSPQWALNNTGVTLGGRPGKAGEDINIAKVWDKFSGSDSLVVAVVDAGFDFNHPDLKGRHWVNEAEAHGKPGVDDDGNGFVDDSVGWDFVDNDNLPQDYHGHGTYVSSVIAAGFDNQIGIAGILARGKIMPIRVLDASGHGDEADIAKGIQYAVKNGAKVINFSIGGDVDNLAMRGAFQVAQNAGVPIVVAAGNDAQDINVQPAYPASYTYDNMLVVAAHDHAGLLCSFSNFGKTAVHLAAPGEFVLVAGLPPPKVIWSENFEEAVPAWRATAGGFALTTVNPFEGKQSLAWTAGNNDTLAWPDTVDLQGSQGATLGFSLDIKSANASDALIVEGNKQGTAVWTELAVIGTLTDLASVQEFGLQDLGGSKFRLRFRTSLSSRFSSAARIFKIDDIRVSIPDPVPPADPVYSVVAGTSLAAPHVTAYVGLQRLACDRMGVPWTRALALTGVDTEAAFVGKVSSNGKLDAYKGLEFYLKTLPDFHVLDSTVHVWKSGEKVQYSLSLSPSPAQTYAFSETGLPDGAAIDGAGMLNWMPAPQQTGDFSVRLLAEGPSDLRKLVTFTVQGNETTAIKPAAGRSAGVWRFAGQSFLLRPELVDGRHLVEVFGTDAAGKVQLFKREWVDARAFAQPQAPGWRGTSPMVFTRWQIRVDGIYLVSGA